MQRFCLLLALLSVLFTGLAQAGQELFLNGSGKSLVPNYSGIFSGDRVNKANWGWGSTVFLELERGTCTGTLISPNYVLTAAHCAVITPKAVYFYNGEKAVASRKVTAWKIHPGYGTKKDSEKWEDHNDIAVLRLESPAPEGFFPVPMLKNASLLTGYVLLQGFGRTGPGGVHNGLTSANLLVVGRDKKSYVVQLADPWKRQAGCVGDSGGPTYVKVDGQYYLAAVSSFIDTKNANCEDADHSTFSVIVVNYLDWIGAMVSVMDSEAH